MNITVYSTPTCGFCQMLKKYLTDKDIAFTETDISTDEAGLKWVLDNTGMAAVPVIDINGTIIVGFDKPKIDAALAA